MLRQQQLFYRDMVLQQGYELSHCIKLLSSEAKALDKYTSEELGFGWLECSVDGIEALIKFANGTEKHDKKLMEMWNILKNYQTANVLSAYSTGTCKSIPSGEIFFIVVEHVDSTLEEFVKHELRLFEQMEDKYEPSDELKKIILDIGSTLDAFSRDGYSFEKFECKDIYIRTDEDATCVKLGKGVSIGKCYPCKLLADLIDEIFEMARKQPSTLVQNLSYLLRSHAGNMTK